MNGRYRHLYGRTAPGMVRGRLSYTRLLVNAMKRNSIAVAIPVLAGFVLLNSQARPAGGEIRVICSNGIKGAMDQLLPKYEHMSGHHVNIQYGASAVLKRGIEEGEPFDLAILTPGVIDGLVNDGKIAGATRTDIARADLAAGVRAGAPKTDISTPEAMKRRLLAAKSITYAKEGAATSAINKMIDRLGIGAELKGKLAIQTESGKAEETVAAGENEIVFAPVSEIIPVHGIEVLGLFPKEFQVPLIMTAAVGAKAQDREGAESLVKFLTSPAAAGAIKKSGMEPVGKK